MKTTLTIALLIATTTSAAAACPDPYGRKLHPSISAPCVFPDPPEITKKFWTLPAGEQWKPPQPRPKVPHSSRRWSI